MMSPFCGFGIDANVLNDYAETKSLFSKVPFMKAGGVGTYAFAAVTRTIPGVPVQGDAPLQGHQPRRRRAARRSERRGRSVRRSALAA
jgi:hypothetical protein